jgi:hypothetical protein
METISSYIGLVQREAKENNLIAILNGFMRLVVLRSIGAHFQNIGLCYIKGLSRGEVKELVDLGKLTVRRLEIH